jgi:PAS domain S-box-containing protein
MPMPMAYDFGTTVLSLVIAVLVTGGAFLVLGGRRLTSTAVALSGAFMGSGIVAMHYVAMAAMRMPAHLSYDPALVALSVVIAVAASVVALWLAFRSDGIAQRIAGAIAMGGAISGMHYTGMAAATFTAHHAMLEPLGIDATARMALGFAVAVATTVILLLALLASAADRRSSQRLSEERMLRLAAIVESSDDAIYGATLDGVITSWNRAAEAMFGYAAAAVIGRPLGFLIPPDRAEEDAIILDQVRRGHRVEHYETVRRSAGGHHIIVSLTVSPILDTTGQVVGISKIARDITERERAAAALRQSEERFRTLADTLPALIFVADADGANTYTNPQFQTYARRSAQDLLGSGWLEVVHPDDRGRAAATWAASRRDGRPYRAEYRLRDGHGGYRWFAVRGTPVRSDGGRVVQWVGSGTEVQALVEAREALARSRDELERVNTELEERVAAAVAERETAQAQLAHAQKIEAVGQLTGGVAHDFNNLLTAIAGNLELIANAAADNPARVRHLAAAALRATERGARLNASLLAFSRKQPLRADAVDANALLQEFAPLVRRAVGEAVQVELALEPALQRCRVDAAQLEAAVLNLAINARDAMAPQGGRLVIESRNAGLGATDLTGNVDAVPGAFIAITVEDDGHGMTPDVLAKAFDPFFTTKEVGRGSGLGLSQVYGFVRQLGGHVAIDSAPGRGTRVTLYLPAAAETGAASVLPGKIAAVDAPMIEATVLVVEDDADVREATRTALQAMGCRVLTAVDGPDALAQLKRGEVAVDLMFTDVVMPNGMSGIELAHAARHLRPELKVLLTSGYTASVLERLADAREFAVLRKPYRHADLAARICAELGTGAAGSAN